MKVETWLFRGGPIFFFPVALIYGFFTHWREPVGPIALGLTAGLAALIAFYLGRTGASIGPRPEDDPAAPIEAAEGDYGFFSPHSWWPLPLAAGGALTFLGVAVGWWLAIIGMFIAAMALVGWVFEYFRGEHAI